MEAEITYIAKDGRRFDDALKCEEHEKSLGIIPNSVGMLIQDLEKLDAEMYIFGIVLTRSDKELTLYTRWTISTDHILEDYVNVENLDDEKRHDVARVGELVKTLKELDKDIPCQYFIIYSKDVDLRCPGCMANHNPKAWKRINNNSL